MMKALWNGFPGGRTGAALLVIRLIVGLAFVLHGLPKIQNPMGWMPPTSPVPGFLQALAALAEFGGGLALIFGLLTPLASLSILVTMAVAVGMVHLPQGHPFVGAGRGPSYETGGLYFVLMIALLLSGPGAFSLDALLFGRRRDAVGNPIAVQ